MKKASLLLFMILFGLVYAQGGVRLTEPLDGTITSDAGQNVNYLFDMAEDVDPSTIELFVNGVLYTTDSSQVIWDPSNLTFIPMGWTDGEVVSCSLAHAEYLDGETIDGLPLVSEFTVDLTEPYLVGYSPSVIWERPDMEIIHDVEEPLEVWIADDHGVINQFTIQVQVNSSHYTILSPGCTWNPDSFYVNEDDDIYFFLGEATTDTFYYGGADSLMVVVTADDTTWFGADGSIDTTYPGTDSTFYTYHGLDGEYVFGPAYPWMELDTIADGYRLTDTSDDTVSCGLFKIDPVAAGFEWPRQDTVRVHLYTASDIPDYGAPNSISTYDTENNLWYFAVDAIGPEYTAIYPYNEVVRPDELIYSSCADLDVIMHFKDNYGIAIPTLSVDIRGAVLDYTDPHITIDTLDADTVIVEADTTITVYEFQMVYTPSPQYYNGEYIDIELLALDDIFGNEFTEVFAPHPWTLYIDRSKPYIGDTYPMDGITTDDKEMNIWFTAFDRLGHVDPQSIHLIIETSSGNRYDYTGYSEVLLPEITWDGTTYRFNPEYVGWEWQQGDTVFATIYTMTDDIDFCSPNVMEDLATSWHFYVSDGPQCSPLAPLDHEYTSCQIQPVSFECIDPDGINPNSVEFMYEGEIFTVNTSEEEYDSHYVGGMLVAVDTTEIFPLQHTGDGHFAFTPPERFEHRDAEEVECSILAAEDVLGNGMWGPSIDWSFIYDHTAPFVITHSPEDGGVAGGPRPYFEIQFGDSVCGMIDIVNTTLTINGLVHGFDLDDEIIWDGITNTLSIDTSLMRLSFAHGEEAEVCITRLYDNPENKCDVLSNPNYLDDPYCWSFTVDNQYPMIDLLEPQDGDHTACANQEIKILLTDDIGVDESSIIMVVQGLMYDIHDSELSMSGDTLIFTPPSAYTHGEEVAFSLIQVADVAGNMISGAPSPLRGFFVVDLAAPTLTAAMPAEGDEVLEYLDEISFTVEDMSGIDWESVEVELDIDGDVYHFITFYEDGDTIIEYDPVTEESDTTIDDLWNDIFTVEGNTITLDLTETEIEFLPGGSHVAVELTVNDDPVWACPAPNTLVENYEFDMNPGWFLDLVINDVDTITLGAFIGAEAGLDEYDIEAPPEAPDSGFLPTVFLLDDGTRLFQDVRDLEVDSPVWEVFAGGEDITVTWDHDDIPPFGSFVINGFIDMRDATVTEFEVEAGGAFYINHGVNFMTMHEGWNLLSTPVIPSDPSPDAVFPDALQVWEYRADEGRYVEPHTIRVGHAYFVLYAPEGDMPDPMEYVIPGVPAYEYTREDVPAGWNAIGSVWQFGGVDFTDPMDVPDGAFDPTLYSYNPETRIYDYSEIIIGGQGYWSYVELPSGFTSAELTVEAWKAGAPVRPTANIDWTSIINIAGMNLTVGRATGDVQTLDRLMPPTPPNGGSYPAYIVDDAAASTKYAAADNAEWTIFVERDSELKLVQDAPSNITLMLDGEVLDANTTVSAGTHVLKAVSASTPESYSLEQNSPNPFNGATSISFQIPEETDVTLSVHDMLGRTIATLTEGKLSAGRHSVNWNCTDDNGTEQPTGVYFYKISTPDYSSTNKMLYIK
ncbi:MAG: FlgD immunoglobulin-like domain containing protein [Candidatus Zixiibacteriota bacterium]